MSINETIENSISIIDLKDEINQDLGHSDTIIELPIKKKKGRKSKKIKVLDAKTGEGISIKQGIVRFLSIPLSILPLLIGLFMIDFKFLIIIFLSCWTSYKHDSLRFKCLSNKYWDINIFLQVSQQIFSFIILIIN